MSNFIMDYRHIIQTADVDEKSSVSKGIKNFHVPKRDNKEVLLEIQDEIKKAKAFLSIPSPTINVTLFDHLAAVLAKIIREKVDNAVDVIESISQTVKREKYSKTPVKSALIEKSESNEKLLKYIKDIQDLFKYASESRDANLDIKHPEDDEEEPPEEEDIQDEDLAEEEEQETVGKKEEFTLRKVMPDLCCHMHHFREAGVGLNCNELLRITMSLKTLALDLKLESLRFWGKCFGTNNDYYIAETPFKEGIKQEEFGWRFSEKQPEDITEPQILEEESALEEEEEVDAGDADEEEETEEPELKYVVIPPVPPLKPPTSGFPPADKNGTGVNKNLYFVCTQPGYPWICLPQCLPEQIIAARQMKKILSGKLNAEVRGYPHFPGKEAHYLRAQIARISAGTIICPKDYFHIPSAPEIDEEGDEETVEEEETHVEPEVTSPTIEINPDYQALSIDDIFIAGTEQWVHERPAVSQEGCSYLNIGIKVESAEGTEETEVQEEAQEEANQDEKPAEEAGQGAKVEEEKQIPLLRCISQDQCGGGLVPWTIKLCSNLMSELAVLILRSNVWPGAYTYYSGKFYENIYIGYGQKYSTRHYAPTLPVTQPEEYPYGPDITEHDYSIMPGEEESTEQQEKEQEESES